MAEVWEDAVEKLGKPLQEVGLDDPVVSQVAGQPGHDSDSMSTNSNNSAKQDSVVSQVAEQVDCDSNRSSKGANSGGYIDIHVGGDARTGTQVSSSAPSYESNFEHLKSNDDSSQKCASDTAQIEKSDRGREGESDLKVKDCYDESASGFHDPCEESTADFCKPGEEMVSCSESEDEDDEKYLSADEGEDEGDDDEKRKEIEEKLTEEERKDLQKQAQENKEKGNGLFKESAYREAIKSYSQALKLCPLCFRKDRSIMFSNRAACKMRMEMYEEAITDCSKALDLNPQYLKALMRRAELYEKTEKLEEALADYEKTLELDPSQYTARMACMRIPDQIKERNEKMKAEMLGKLKDLGNMVLKPFGLSTDNFQMKQDPATGSYSVNFNQNGK